MAIDSLHELRGLLNSTGFDASQLIEVPVLDTSESSFAVEIDPREVVRVCGHGDSCAILRRL